MIVVIGSPSGSLAVSIAFAATGRGRMVQLVGRMSDGPAADVVLQELARHGVGHVAVLRDPSDQPMTLDGADVELALRYLTDFDVLAVIDGGASVLEVAERAATWGGASLLVVSGEPGPATTDRTHIAPTSGESAAAFAERVGELASSLDEAAAAVRAAR